jgi:hypothetical protein
VKLIKVTILLVCLSLVFTSPGFGFTTNNTATTRVFDKNEAAAGQPITVTVTFTNSEASSLRGFYFAEQIPQGLVVNTIMGIRGRWFKCNFISSFEFRAEEGGTGSRFTSEGNHRG